MKTHVAFSIVLQEVKMQNAILDAIAHRSSIRQYTDEPVSREQLITIMKAAMAAPSGMNMQPWEFVAIDKREILDALGDALPYAKMLHHAPVALVVCGDTAKECALPITLWPQDCAAATQNALLAAEALGLGAVWTAVYPNEQLVAIVKTILGLPENITPFCVIPIGHPAKEGTPKDKFNPERMHWNQF